MPKKKVVDGRPLVLSREEVMRLEEISRREYFERTRQGEYVKAKTGERKPNGEKIYGIPAWCLSPRGQRRFLREHPEFRAYLKLTSAREPR